VGAERRRWGRHLQSIGAGGAFPRILVHILSFAYQSRLCSKRRKRRRRVLCRMSVSPRSHASPASAARDELQVEAVGAVVCGTRRAVDAAVGDTRRHAHTYAARSRKWTGRRSGVCRGVGGRVGKSHYQGYHGRTRRHETHMHIVIGGRCGKERAGSMRVDSVRSMKEDMGATSAGGRATELNRRDARRAGCA
jgi:hypothetical protein